MIRLKLIKSPPKKLRDNSVLLITGDGQGLEEDLGEFLSWHIDHDVMCIGRSIRKYPFHVKHYTDVDSDAGKWVLENLYKTHPKKGRPIRHTLGDVDWCDACWDSDDIDIDPEDVRWHGSSALFGALIGLEMGYGAIVLAGCPMDKMGHWYYGPEHRGPNWQYSDLAAWLEFKKDARSNAVRSLSGYTAQVLDRATQEWASWQATLSRMAKQYGIHIDNHTDQDRRAKMVGASAAGRSE